MMVDGPAINRFYGMAGGAFTLVVICMSVLMLGSCTPHCVLAPENPATEEERLSVVINKTNASDALADAYLCRAKLRSMADNPHVNYIGALKDLKAAVALNPQLSGEKDIKDWMAILGRLATTDRKVGRVKEKNEQAQRQIRTLRDNIQQLERQEQELRKTIEDLKTLELQREQRRQQLR
ncbi:MAG TPA: prefoldin domain-containing protein [Dissulfurispiraceae bacterium]|nr:prefoldin domain-containing protein [Dissulfurispiraceae bacterium]